MGKKQIGYEIYDYFRFGFALEGECPVIISCYRVRELEVKR